MFLLRSFDPTYQFFIGAELSNPFKKHPFKMQDNIYPSSILPSHAFLILKLTVHVWLSEQYKNDYNYIE